MCLPVLLRFLWLSTSAALPAALLPRLRTALQKLKQHLRSRDRKWQSMATLPQVKFPQLVQGMEWLLATDPYLNHVADSSDWRMPDVDSAQLAQVKADVINQVHHLGRKHMQNVTLYTPYCHKFNMVQTCCGATVVLHALQEFWAK